MAFKTLGIIPARGGSKGIPKKNIAPLAGKPLLAYTIEQAADKASGLDKFVISTDDRGIADVAKSLGAEVPFLRPADLAEDDTPDLPVIQHALEFFNWEPELIVILRPTCPLRTAEDISQSIGLLKSPETHSVRSVTLAEHSPYWMYKVEEDRLVKFAEGDYPRRQDLPQIYRLNGVVDATKASIVKKGSLYGDNIAPLIIEPERAIDIDTPQDLKIAEFLINESKNRK